MPKIVITNLDEGLSQSLSERAGVSWEGQSESLQVLGGDRPIHLWKHTLAPGAVGRWARLPVGRIIFLWRGSVFANGQAIDGEGAVMVERGAACEVRAGETGCELVEFQAVVEETERPGGHVHALSQAQAPHAMVGSIGIRSYADCGCPTCELWLHENTVQGNFHGSRHFHDQDEVIICTEGTMMLGTRELKRGGVLAINRDAVYSFSTAAEDLRFINFRPGPSMFVELDKDGKKPPQDEQRMVRSWLKTTPHEVAAALS